MSSVNTLSASTRLPGTGRTATPVRVLSWRSPASMGLDPEDGPEPDGYRGTDGGAPPVATGSDHRPARQEA